MRISKANHLIRLLQTQDVLIGTLCYLSAICALWLIGDIHLVNAIMHLQLTPFVVLFCLVATLTQTPLLHGQTVLKFAVFSMRYGLILLTGMLAVAYIGRLEFVSRLAILGSSTLIFTALFANRLFLRWWYFQGHREHPSNYLKTLVIGNGDRARRLIDAYLSKSDWGVEIVGLLDPRASDPLQVADGMDVLGGVELINEILATKVVDEVVVCLPRSLINEIEEVIRACDEQAICVKFLADIYDMPSGATLHLDSVGKIPILSFDPVHQDEGKLIAKRIMDLLVTIPVIILLLPLFLLVALAIKLNSSGPIFFTQDRVGLNKRSFRMIKFRSMFKDAELRLADIEHLNEAEGPIFKVSDDPRITRVGRYIRRASIDELPQLFNVILGDMSLVGPRPMSLRDVSRFSLSVQRRRFSIRPGLACLREVSGRSRLSFDKWLELDLKYIDEWSLWLDIKILFLLVPSVIRGDGAS